jgi:hypothetical protein
MTNIYADRLATVMARFMTAGDAAKLVEPVEVVDEREATFTLQAPDNRVFQISVMDVTDDVLKGGERRCELQPSSLRRLPR